jgi:hypothetical protein
MINPVRNICVEPARHAHEFHAAFDLDEQAVLRHWDWKHTPLDEEDYRSGKLGVRQVDGRKAHDEWALVVASRGRGN